MHGSSADGPEDSSYEAVIYTVSYGPRGMVSEDPAAVGASEHGDIASSSESINSVGHMYVSGKSSHDVAAVSADESV